MTPALFVPQINGIQGAGLEHHLFHTVTWNGTTIGCLIGYVCAMLFLYSLAPILFRLSSSPFYNLCQFFSRIFLVYRSLGETDPKPATLLAILTSDFFGLLIGLRVFGYHPYWLYVSPSHHETVLLVVAVLTLDGARPTVRRVSNRPRRPRCLLLRCATRVTRNQRRCAWQAS